MSLLVSLSDSMGRSGLPQQGAVPDPFTATCGWPFSSGLTARARLFDGSDGSHGGLLAMAAAWDLKMRPGMTRKIRKSAAKVRTCFFDLHLCRG